MEKEMKLISMTEFVLMQFNKEDKGINALIIEYGKIVDYAKFLKIPLTLGIFVPCDEKGNPLPEPKMRHERNSFDGEDMDYDAQELYEYIQAKEKVLFKGLSYKFGMIGYSNDSGWSSVFDLDFRPNSVIENLLNDKKEYTLTQTAIKQIGL